MDDIKTSVYRSLLETAGISQRELARQLKVNERTVRHWMAGDNPMPESAAKELRRLAENAEKSKSIPYLVGRMAALLEDVCPRPLSAGQSIKLITHPLTTSPLYMEHVVRSPWHSSRMMEIMGYIPADGLPATLIPKDQGTAWVGYYHEQSAIERHAQKVRAVHSDEAEV